MITIHHLGISQSERIIWLCEEYDIPYEVVRHERDPETRLAPESYKALHPMGTAPVIADGDLVLGETNAIFDYLLGKYAPGKGKLPPEHPDFAQFLFWYHYPQGSFMPAGMMRMVTEMVADVLPETARTGLNARFVRGLDMIEARLTEATWLAGDTFTAADIMMVFCLTTAKHFLPIDVEPFGAIRTYLGRVQARESYVRAMKIAEPDMPITPA